MTKAKLIFPNTKLLKQLIKIIQKLFTPIALAFLGIAIYNSWGEVSNIFIQANLVMFFPAILLWSLTNLLPPLVTLSILKPPHPQLTYSELRFIHFNRLPAKFIPGGIWQTVGRISDLKKRGIKYNLLASLVLIENILPLSITTGVGGSILYFFQKTGFYYWLTLCAAFLGIITLFSIPIATQKIKKINVIIPLRNYLAACIITSLFWLTATSCFLLYMSSFKGVIQTVNIIELAGIYLISWAIGFVSVFTPQGIGVFEAVASKMMQSAAPDFAFLQIIALIAGFRLLVILGDALSYFCWGTLLIYKKNMKK